MRWVCIVGLAALLTAVGSASVYTVTNNGDSGAGSFRQALTDANSAAGADTIQFDNSMKGQTIQVLSQLPGLYGNAAGTDIRGDIDNDGDPDVALDGGGGAFYGLIIQTTGVDVRGLAIYNFGSWGLYIYSAADTTVVTCHIGVNLTGSTLRANVYPIYIYNSPGTVIGGSTAQKNVIGIASNASYRYGIYVYDTDNLTITGNHIGVARGGGSALGSGGTGIYFYGSSDPAGCDGGQIGDTGAGQGNVIAGTDTGIHFQYYCRNNTIEGNILGLGADGLKSVPIATTGIRFDYGPSLNNIGGTTEAARNLFGTVPTGILLFQAGTTNRIRGNYFGLAGDGATQRPMDTCVRLTNGTAAQTIGGGGAAGNFFLPNSSGGVTTGLHFESAGSGSRVMSNFFGVKPGGANGALMNQALLIDNVSAKVTGNVIARAQTGLNISGNGNKPRVFRNTFRNCGEGVHISGTAECLLGILSNPATSDDGKNKFLASNTMHIVNGTTNAIKAEGNDFGTTVKADIEAKIFHKPDDSGVGFVDFSPLKNGVIPTGGTEGATLALSGAAASGTAAGAEIVYSLSAPASVTVSVLNVAGRPVAVAAQDVRAEAGMQRILWAGQTTHGTPAPSGTYLVRISARDDSGQQVQALCSLQLRR